MKIGFMIKSSHLILKKHQTGRYKDRLFFLHNDPHMGITFPFYAITYKNSASKCGPP